ncbi:hypothetical protein ES705_19046 [subsurface metagenome]
MAKTRCLSDPKILVGSVIIHFKLECIILAMKKTLAGDLPGQFLGAGKKDAHTGSYRRFDEEMRLIAHLEN